MSLLAKNKLNSFFRLSDWKDTHLFFIFIGVAIFSLIYKVDFQFFLENLLFLLFIGLFSGALGYYFNDVCDVQSDIISNKKNFALKHTVFQRIAILIILLGGVFLTWYWLSKDLTILGLLSLETFLFIIYSSPPFRFKENPIFSTLIDSLYAFVIPATILLTLFFDYSQKLSLVEYIYLFWLFLFGVRSILSHHISDYHNDVQSKTNTTTIKFGLAVIAKLRLLVIAPIEFVFFIILNILVSKYLLLCFVLFLFLCLFRQNENGQYLVLNINKNLNTSSDIILENYYVNVFPFILLIFLVVHDWHFLFSILILLGLFGKRLKMFYSELDNLIFKWFKRIGNSLIYNFFLIFGVDLIKLNMSALRYLINKIILRVN